MCLDSEKRINTTTENHSDDPDDNDVSSRRAVCNGHAAGERTRNAIELFPSPNQSVPIIDIDEAQKFQEAKKPTKVQIKSGSNTRSFWALVRSPSALLASYLRSEDESHTPQTPKQEIELQRLRVDDIKDPTADETKQQLPAGRRTGLLLIPVAFFFSAVGYTVTWTVIQSQLALYKMRYGNGFFLKLNACYYAPSLPMLFLQGLYDDYYDQKYGRRFCHTIRNTFALGVAFILTLIFAWIQSGGIILVLTALLGLVCSISFGSTYQLAPAFPPSCTVALTLGYVGSGPLVLLSTFLVGFGNEVSTVDLAILYGVMSIFVVSGFIATVFIIYQPEIRHLKAELAGDDIEGLVGPLLGDMADDDNDDSDVLVKTEDEVIFEEDKPLVGAKKPLESNYELWRQVAPCAIPLGVNMIGTILVYPFFTFIESSRGDMCLSQKLFYCRMCADCVGRLVNLHPSIASYISSTKMLGSLVSIRTASFVPFFFGYLSAIWPFGRSDVLIGIGVFLFWLIGGLLNTSAYKMAPTLVPMEYKARAGSVMTFTFQTSIIIALSLGFIIRYTCF